MTISKTMRRWILIILAMVSVAAVLAYHSIRSNCCSETLTVEEFRLVVRDAENGDVAAMKRLFFYFDEEEDSASAHLWLQRAADAGDAQAELFLHGKLFGSGDAAKRALAAQYLIRAAEHGSPTAQALLGKSYRDGAGVPKNIEQAEYWLRRSALTGDPDAILALCDLALLRGNRKQCEECLRLNTLGLASVDRQSYFARELVSQKERIIRGLKDWDRGPQ